jgi:hypothetical protein
MKKQNYRHGDVILIPSTVPEKAIEKKGLTLAEGEVTGHSHRISEGAAQMFKFNEKTYLRVTSPLAALVHEEHKRIDLPCGDFEVIIQQDYEPEGWKRVRD